MRTPGDRIWMVLLPLRFTLIVSSTSCSALLINESETSGIGNPKHEVVQQLERQAVVKSSMETMLNQQVESVGPVVPVQVSLGRPNLGKRSHIMCHDRSKEVAACISVIVSFSHA